MIKVIAKDKNGKGVNVKYKSSNTNTYEHISGMCALYKEIKANTNLTDEEIFDAILNYFNNEGDEE